MEVRSLARRSNSPERSSRPTDSHNCPHILMLSGTSPSSLSHAFDVARMASARRCAWRALFVAAWYSSGALNSSGSRAVWAIFFSSSSARAVAGALAEVSFSMRRSRSKRCDLAGMGGGCNVTSVASRYRGAHHNTRDHVNKFYVRFRCDLFILLTTFSIVGDIMLTESAISAITVEPSTRDPVISIPVSGPKSTSHSNGSVHQRAPTAEHL